jgi:hypothetical protein
MRKQRQAAKKRLLKTAEWVYENTGSDFEACVEVAQAILEDESHADTDPDRPPTR